jgi:recombination protein RecT
MYAKTVLKNTLSKWGIMSVTMQSAIVADQGVIKSFDKPIDNENVRYIDSTDQDKQTENADEGETVPTPPVSGDKKDANVSQAQEQAPKEPEGKEKDLSNPPENSTGLFGDDEAAALEEQYEREQMGPDWGERK